VVGGVAAGFAVITASNVPFTCVAGLMVVAEYPGWQVTHCTPWSTMWSVWNPVVGAVG
jgi:hypothetical protein